MIDHVRDTLRKASKAVEAPRRRTEEVVRKLAENPNFDVMDAPHIAKDLLRLGREQAEKARSLVDDGIRRRLTTMGIATKDEVERLHRRIAELEATAGAGPSEERPPPAATRPASVAGPGGTPANGRATGAARAADRGPARGRAGATPKTPAARPARSTRAKSPRPESPSGGSAHGGAGAADPAGVEDEGEE